MPKSSISSPYFLLSTITKKSKIIHIIEWVFELCTGCCSYLCSVHASSSLILCFLLSYSSHLEQRFFTSSSQ
ncbi:hypothetical protein MtrunA17_Chr1g0176491 [Medicago truncatula]|uniref:Uncharacterized protein n=1 Tax=Medicago truncatula TaxID=3880 RepID=A0A396JM47_MEDTR|nr:hypothetical protein MtrunA17_Chr1g0176491 [Medicago truncatula]